MGLDLNSAVQYNRTSATQLGWSDKVDRIVTLLGYTSFTPNEEEFARGVARWQQTQTDLAVDGKITPETWAKMQPAVQTSGYFGPAHACGPKIDDGRRRGGLAAGSLIATYDANIRITEYVQPAEELSKRILRDLKDAEAKKYVSHQAARDAANFERNQLLGKTRSKLSPGARALSEAIKEEGKQVPELLEYYAAKRLNADPGLARRFGLETMDPKSAKFDPARFRKAVEVMAETEDLSIDVIKAAGRTNKAMSFVARCTRVAGPVGAAVGFASSTYEVIEAPEDDKMYVVGREASGFAGGLVGSVGGGLLAGWIASLACGPGMAVCAMAVSVIVVGGSAYGGGWLAEEGYKKTVGPPPSAR